MPHAIFSLLFLPPSDHTRTKIHSNRGTMQKCNLFLKKLLDLHKFTCIMIDWLITVFESAFCNERMLSCVNVKKKCLGIAFYWVKNTVTDINDSLNIIQWSLFDNVFFSVFNLSSTMSCQPLRSFSYPEASPQASCQQSNNIPNKA